MSRPSRRMLTLPTAQEFTQGTNPIRLHKKRDRFLFMTYNLLAQGLIRRDMFPHASQKALRWKFRKQNILQEFLAFNPDLACLQEVDFWDEVYHPALTKAGYEAVYYKNQNKKHGCAIIWRKSRFEKVDQLTLEYDDIGQPTFMTGNIGLMVGLRPLKHQPENPDPNADMVLPEEKEDHDQGSTGNGTTDDDGDIGLPGGILVATTHLFWRPDGSYERLRQASILLDRINEWNQKLNYTVLLGGDFNTTPRDAAYRAMTRNKMPPRQIPDLEKWLVEEVTRVQEAETEAAVSASQETDDESKKPVDADQHDADVEQLSSQTAKLGLNGITDDTTNGKKKEDEKVSDLPYRAPPTGIILPKNTSTKSSSAEPESTIQDPASFASSNDPKIKNLATTSASCSGGEDAPVLAPLEAFTPPRDLLASIETHVRCISIYGQYESLIKDNSAEVNAKLATATATQESTATEASKEHTHGEPIFTNFATWFKDTLDYVYLFDEPRPENGARLVPLRLLEIPDQSFLGHGLPDENFSSDHLCLMVEFAILSR
ncbi:Endonuclease/exonuclease/phosphatase [Gamsiella multidivaricata]|uniref:Endonuclease/exonuclease/phosphatase n=1 Tax=Gamsiella multidivaricata TaxID=101098 RepID=UPI002220CA92|nr:Endonuclease/exonuclease/phosphatase [Gamsiella multidivaricata]KAG0368617.1 hypothetical protein BGZ54_001534 [Gamsiella multidivaricata]KAI7819889.1 Endonuclease/exonuclease/phosphatase [Gamsiella multidivaricata]